MADKSTVNMVRMTNLIVYAEDGHAVPMKSLWRQGPAIFIFLRHFSCMSCRAHVEQIWAHRLKLEQDGARIYFIGNGSFREIANFKKEMNLEKVAIFTDPSRRTYEAAGLRRGIAAILGPKAIANGIGMLKQGRRQRQWGREAGDLWQLGGILVVNPGASVRYHYISKTIGDLPGATGLTSVEGPAPVTEETPQVVGDFSIR